MPRTSRARFVPEPPIYVFRVRILGGFYAPPGSQLIWREIALAANQTLDKLAEAIPLAFDFDDPHMWSFFLSGKPWDTASEYTLYPERDEFSGQQARDASRAHIRTVPFPGKTGKKEFLFLFDYGDEWHFGVKLLREIPTVDPAARYPQVVASEGVAPPQYPDYDEDEEGEDGEDDETGFLVIELDKDTLAMLGLPDAPWGSDKLAEGAEGNIVEGKIAGVDPPHG